MSQIALHFEEISHFLVQNEAFWRGHPFTQDVVGWYNSHPHWKNFFISLDAKSVDQVERIKQLPTNAPTDLKKVWKRCQGLSKLESFSLSDLVWPERYGWGIKERKWSQIKGFACSSWPEFQDVRRVIEWCSGKGHLSRSIIKHLEAEAIGCEQNSALCEAGDQWALKERVRLSFERIDLLEQSPTLLDKDVVIGLHACGELSDRACCAVIEKRVPLVLAPCCDHRREYPYIPLSRRGQLTGLRLLKPELMLASACESVASERRKQLRRRSNLYRVALDILVRQSTGVDRYRSFPSVPRSAIAQGFDGFIGAIKSKASIDFEPYDAAVLLQQAEERCREIRALSLLRHHFGQVIERWMFFDKCIWLQQNGFRVRAGTFVDTSITPRNSMLIATPIEGV